MDIIIELLPFVSVLIALSAFGLSWRNWARLQAFDSPSGWLSNPKTDSNGKSQTTLYIINNGAKELFIRKVIAGNEIKLLPSNFNPYRGPEWENPDKYSVEQTVNMLVPSGQKRQQRLIFFCEREAIVSVTIKRRRGGYEAHLNMST